MADPKIDIDVPSIGRATPNVIQDGTAGRMNHLICPQDVLIGERFARPETSGKGQDCGVRADFFRKA